VIHNWSSMSSRVKLQGQVKWQEGYNKITGTHICTGLIAVKGWN
jgi:hypothetical protein